MENKFYTAEKRMKRVSRAELDAFLANYPRKLTYDCNCCCDPPALSWNDFALADRWPYSIVASTYAYDDNPGEYYYEKEENRCYVICENAEECFASKTGYAAENDAKDRDSNFFVKFVSNVRIENARTGEVLYDGPPQTIKTNVNMGEIRTGVGTPIALTQGQTDGTPKTP